MRKLKFMFFESADVALAAVQQDGDAIRYVPDFDMAVRVGLFVGIEVTK